MLGIQTYEAWRHLRPERTLVIENTNSPYVSRHEDRYPDSWCVARPDELDEALMARFFDGLSCVFSAETFYNWHACDWARERGVRTVAQANPEFFVWATGDDPRPSKVVVPTHWRLEALRQHVPDLDVLPFPVARDVLPPRKVEKVETLLHIAGHRAVHDRNGTALLFVALRFVREPCRVVIRTQSDLRGARVQRIPKYVQLEIVQEDAADYASLYDGADALVLTRRYGGLSLPIQEAMSLGLPCIVTDREPERSWITDERARVKTTEGRQWQTQGGTVMVEQPDARALAAAIDRLVGDPELAASLSHDADAWAGRHSWEAMLPQYEAVLRG